MREILFKGAQKVDCTKSLIWYEGSVIIETDGYTGEKEYYIQNENGSYLVIPKTIGQYTGLTDKNGKKIFEGDILKGKFGTGMVNYNNGCFCVKGYPYKSYFNNPAIDVVMNEDCIEIIGNIHDNPELLKEVH